ncbi:hypothetical protein PR048_007987 [Dryococelus australis]|uniref:Uncharacterized protein n=1 Tax=Dryococelus australis TaxID=614101 RepID=A0ABQ9HVU2_9NEOP|nr:hypothetical protein PR048_007987 [Dryococelus australis]
MLHTPTVRNTQLACQVLVDTNTKWKGLHAVMLHTPTVRNTQLACQVLVDTNTKVYENQVRRVRSSVGMQGWGETGDPRENRPTSGIVRYNSHIRKSGSYQPGSPTWEASSLTITPLRPPADTKTRNCVILKWYAVKKLHEMTDTFDFDIADRASERFLNDLHEHTVISTVCLLAFLRTQCDKKLHSGNGRRILPCPFSIITDAFPQETPLWSSPCPGGMLLPELWLGVPSLLGDVVPAALAAATVTSRLIDPYVFNSSIKKKSLTELTHEISAVMVSCRWNGRPWVGRAERGDERDRRPYCDVIAANSYPLSLNPVRPNVDNLSTNMFDFLLLARLNTGNVHPICTGHRYDGNIARLTRRSDEALGVRVSVARIAPSLFDLRCTALRLSDVYLDNYRPTRTRHGADCVLACGGIPEALGFSDAALHLWLKAEAVNQKYYSEVPTKLRERVRKKRPRTWKNDSWTSRKCSQYARSQESFCKPTSRGAVGWCAADLWCGRFWLRILDLLTFELRPWVQRHTVIPNVRQPTSLFAARRSLTGVDGGAKNKKTSQGPGAIFLLCSACTGANEMKALGKFSYGRVTATRPRCILRCSDKQPPASGVLKRGFSSQTHSDTGDNNTHDQRPVAPMHEALNLCTVLLLLRLPVQMRSVTVGFQYTRLNPIE